MNQVQSDQTTQTTVQSMLGQLLGTCHPSRKLELLPLLPKSGSCLIIGKRQCGKSLLAEKLSAQLLTKTFTEWDDKKPLDALDQGYKCIRFTMDFPNGVDRRSAFHQFQLKAASVNALVIYEFQWPAFTLATANSMDWVFAFPNPSIQFCEMLSKRFFNNVPVTPLGDHCCMVLTPLKKIYVYRA